MKAVVSIIMGSTSDMPVMKKAAEFLNNMEIPFEINALSAHRTPEIVEEFASNARESGIKVIIAGAGGAAHLPGVVAAFTTVPVIGVPCRSSISIDGWDSILSILQMPPGIPVATVGLDGSLNAGILAAQILATKENSKMSFSIIPSETKTLLQLRVSNDNAITSSMQISETPAKINPLGFFKINELNRSNYFSTGNYPLNSIFQIVILANEEIRVSDIKGNTIPTQTIDGMEIPTEITKNGWIFDPKEGTQIQGKYIFGENTSIDENELKFSLKGNNDQIKETGLDESITIVTIITIISIGAAIFYLKGYKK